MRVGSIGDSGGAALRLPGMLDPLFIQGSPMRDVFDLTAIWDELIFKPDLPTALP